MKASHIVLSAVLLGCSLAAAAAPAAGVEARLSHFKVVPEAGGQEKLVPAEQAKPGEVIEYRVAYTNLDPAPARDIQATLPIPEGTSYVAGSARPAKVAASVDGVAFAPVPLKRKVRGAGGKEVEEAVPLDEYRFLRWNLGDLPAGKGLPVSARVRVNAAATPAVAAKGRAQ